MLGWTVGILKYSRNILISSLPYQGDDSGRSNEEFELSTFLLGKRTPNKTPTTITLCNGKEM